MCLCLRVMGCFMYLLLQGKNWYMVSYDSKSDMGFLITEADLYVVPAMYKVHTGVCGTIKHKRVLPLCFGDLLFH